jgi:hypothetical protein
MGTPSVRSNKKQSTTNAIVRFERKVPMRLSTQIGIVLLLVLLAAAGCSTFFVRPGEEQHFAQTVELEDAERVNVNIQSGIQDLTLTGGTAALFQGDFTYNLDELEPIIDYSVSNGVGDLDIRVRGSNFSRLPFGNIISEWNLQLNEEVPLALDIALGLGDSQIDLSDLNLTAFDLQSGAGTVNVDVGQQELERVQVRAGLGDINLILGGGSIDEFDFEAGAGRVAVDLAGNWQSDMDATIRGGLGDIELTVPGDVGVRIEVNTGLGGVDIRGFNVDGDVYTNDAYGESEVTLDITVSQGAGSIDIRTAE